MTGLANDGSYLLVQGNNYYGNRVIQKFSATGSTSSVYMDDFPGMGNTVYDTAWISGGIWIARDNSDSPILAYDTSGLLVGHVEGTTVSAAMGLTIDDQGYLWASNPEDDTIYQLDVSTGIESGGPAVIDRELSLSRNPFVSSVVVSAQGFSGATIEIFDLTGRRVHTDGFSGVYTWNASGMPPGSYFAVVRDDEGSSAARFTKLN